MRRALLLAAVVLALLAGEAAAHQRSISYSTWELHGRAAQVTVRLTELDLSWLPWTSRPGHSKDEAVGDYLVEHLALLAGGTPCAVSHPPRRLPAPSGKAIYSWGIDCPPSGALAIRSDILLDLVPSHLHFARVRADGSHPLERVLSEGERVWQIETAGGAGAASPPRGTSLLSYLAMGVGHIWTGYDHLAFLLALLLFRSTLAEVARVVTGFTLAHSLTLALATLGYLRPDSAPIEALIGLSIALVAVENLWLLAGRNRLLPWILAGVLACLAGIAFDGVGRVPGLTLGGLALFTLCYFGLLENVSRPGRLRWFVAFIFGLVHGFGFAGVLAEARLPADRLAHALLGFNLGVEVGQLAVVLAAWPVLLLAARADRGRAQGAIFETGSAAVLALGLFWFVTRAYGG